MLSELRSPKVAILMAKAGGGHVAAARSLAEALEGRAQVVFVNLLDDYAPFPLNQLSAAYGPWVNYAPVTYQLAYKLLSVPHTVDMLQRAAHPLVRSRVAAALAAVRPDLVISVHPAQVAVVLRILRGLGNCAPFVTVVTDPVTPPIAWFCPDVDLTIVATDEARQVALACGLPADRVEVIGLPIRRAFATVRSQAKSVLRRQLGLDPERSVLLFSGGGAGIGSQLLAHVHAVADRLAASRTPAQMVVIAGHNRSLRRRLRQEQLPVPLLALGYVENMAEWMAASDLLITKAGPGTLAEAACLGLPTLIMDFVPGQEEGNVSWVGNRGAGIYVREPAQAALLAEELLRPGNPRLAAMAVGAHELARCNAAAQIAEATLALWRQVAGVPK